MERPYAAALPREGAGPALRREPAPERGLLPLLGREGAHARARRAAPGQGALLQQHPRHRRVLDGRARVRASRAASSSSTPTRAAPASTPTSSTAYRQAHGRRPDAARTAGSWRSIARSPPSVVEAIIANKQFVEVMIAPDYEPARPRAPRDQAQPARAAHRRRRARRRPLRLAARSRAGCSSRRATRSPRTPSTFTVPTKRQPDAGRARAAAVRVAVAKTVKSNAILLAKDFVTVGVGGGQMNRVNSARIAVEQAGEKARGARGRERRVHAVPRHARGRRRPRASRRSSSRAARSATARPSRRPTSSVSRWCSPATGTSGTSGRCEATSPRHRAVAASHGVTASPHGTTFARRLRVRCSLRAVPAARRGGVRFVEAYYASPVCRACTTW